MDFGVYWDPSVKQVCENMSGRDHGLFIYFHIHIRTQLTKLIISIVSLIIVYNSLLLLCALLHAVLKPLTVSANMSLSKSSFSVLEVSNPNAGCLP